MFIDCSTECAECIDQSTTCTSCASPYYPFDNKLGCNTTSSINHYFFEDDIWKGTLCYM